MKNRCAHCYKPLSHSEHYWFETECTWCTWWHTTQYSNGVYVPPKPMTYFIRKLFHWLGYLTE